MPRLLRLPAAAPVIRPADPSESYLAAQFDFSQAQSQWAQPPQPPPQLPPPPPPRPAARTAGAR